MVEESLVRLPQSDDVGVILIPDILLLPVSCFEDFFTARLNPPESFVCVAVVRLNIDAGSRSSGSSLTLFRPWTANLFPASMLQIVYIKGPGQSSAWLFAL